MTLDKVVGSYVDSLNKENGKVVSDSEKQIIRSALKDKVLQEVSVFLKDSVVNAAKKEAQEKAGKEKKRFVRKFKITLIIETLFIAFLVGIIVNQVTNLIPNHAHISLAVITIAFLACVLMVHLSLGKD